MFAKAKHSEFRVVIPPLSDFKSNVLTCEITKHFSNLKVMYHARYFNATIISNIESEVEEWPSCSQNTIIKLLKALENGNTEKFIHLIFIG